MFTLQRILGHSTLEMTRRYVEMVAMELVYLYSKNRQHDLADIAQIRVLFIPFPTRIPQMFRVGSPKSVSYLFLHVAVRIARTSTCFYNILQ